MKIAIIGAGAAGMIAAATLTERGVPGSDIFLFDKNPKIGVKVALTGGGRCNITTAITERKLLFSKYTRGADFLKYAFEEFGPRKVYQWFENNGLPLYTQDDQRVFPRSNQGDDVIEVFEVIFQKNKVNVKIGEGVISIEKQGEIFSLISDRHSYLFDAIIITTGGNAYAHTGSSGDGYSLARSLGHTITRLGPSLNSFEVKEDWCKELSGIAFPNARLNVDMTCLSSGMKRNEMTDPVSSKDGSFLDSSLSLRMTKNISITGPLLFTHFGISGPVTFSLSSHIAFEKIDAENLFSVGISIDTTKDYQTWDRELRNAFEKEPAKLVKNILSHFVPARFSDIILSTLGIDKECSAAHFNKDDRKKLIHALTGQLKITLIRRRPGDEFVTAGGISLNEVNPKTMESKIVSGLFFGGEVLDVDGVTGGFNLQSAWATGRMAALNVFRQ